MPPGGIALIPERLCEPSLNQGNTRSTSPASVARVSRFCLKGYAWRVEEEVLEKAKEARAVLDHIAGMVAGAPAFVLAGVK